MIVSKTARLAGEEVRFLRTYLGFRGVDFARVMGVEKETVSRWENDHERIGGTADRALRLLVLTRKPASDYAPEALTQLLEGIREETEALRLRVERSRGSRWAGSAEVRA